MIFLTFGIIGLVLGLACSQHAVGPNHSRIPERGKAQVTARLATAQKWMIGAQSLVIEGMTSPHTESALGAVRAFRPPAASS
jgi:hypothetical protein